MAKSIEREHAVIMRKNGISISAIAKKLCVSKSTASVWCQDVSLTLQQIEEIGRLSKHHATVGLLKASEKQRMTRLNNIEIATREGKASVGKLSKRDIYMIGLGLYWGEGYKKGSQELGFTNSDPAMILFYIKWLHEVFRIEKENLILRVSINSLHTYRVHEVEKYWSKLINIPKTQFTKTSLIKVSSKKVYKNIETHFGTLRIKVRRGTDLRRKILGAISALT